MLALVDRSRPAAPRPRAPLVLLPAAELDRLRLEVQRLLALPRGTESHLAGAVRDTLASPGSLWRAQLAWATGRVHGLAPRVALDLALGIEAFHTASLLFDDLPAMDDAVTRRGRPCVHRVHGEAAALLAALGFVHRGYALVWRALAGARPRPRRAAAALLEECLGLTGILDGQAWDLHLEGAGLAGERCARVVAGKTVPLLRLALELPAVVAGAPAARRRLLAELARRWGLAYQTLDDVEDRVAAPDAAAAGDAELGRPNLAGSLGATGALAQVDEELAAVRPLLAALESALGPDAAPYLRLDGHLRSARWAAAARCGAPAPAG